ncbi:hypothetical protein KDL29_11340 [bacterium]|nr:hypothetical protein [bacterium]
MRTLICTCLLGILYLLPPPAAAAPLEGYRNHAALKAEMERMAQAPECELMSIGKTAEGRDILVLRIGGSIELLNAVGDTMARPAIAVIGNTQASDLAGREICLELAQRVLDSLDDDTELLAFLEQHDFYFLPSPTPDATEYFFTNGDYERETNGTPSDDDRDGRVDEDPGEDLNGDGMLTMMRVSDPAGEWMEHPDDPRVLIRAKRDDNEQGSWRLYSEGRDNDDDEQWNEDRSGGVDFNRNTTFNYDDRAEGSGPWPVSEPETRSVIDWLFNNQQISIVLSFGPEDNIRQPWKDDHGKLRHESAEGSDIGNLDYIAKQGVDLIGKENFPGSANPRGSFADWAYFHYGAWSISTRAWWVPEFKPEAPAEGEAAEEGKEAEKPKKSDEKRGADEINALKWFESQGIDGFVDWTDVANADFPGRTVQVGGFRPYLRSNPPASEIAGLATKHFDFLRMLTGLVPAVAISEVEVDDLGEGLYRVTAHVTNSGYLPTSTRKAASIRQDYPLNIALELPAGASLLNGALRGRLDRIEGLGAQTEFSWLVVAPQGGAIRLVVASPSVGMARGSAELGS